jgi:hypothetical protein
MSNKKENAWYIDFIVGMLCLVLIWFINQNYNEYMARTSSEGGKGGKLGLLVLKSLDEIGGKELVISVLLIISFLCFWWAYRKYEKMKY